MSIKSTRSPLPHQDGSIAIPELSDQYVAGLFDGEGWFNIGKAWRIDTRRGASYQMRAGICVRDLIVLQGVHVSFGGSLRLSKKATDRHAAYYIWSVHGVGASAFASRLAPYLVIKSAQALLAIAFQTEKSLNKNQPCSAERFARLTSMYNEMKKLNQRGPK